MTELGAYHYPSLNDKFLFLSVDRRSSAPPLPLKYFIFDLIGVRSLVGRINTSDILVQQ